MWRLPTTIVLLASLLAVMVAGCSDPVTEPIELVAFDLRNPTPDPAAPTPLAEPSWGLHWLDRNWDASPDLGQGVWAHAPEATVRLELTGREATLRLVVSTTPALSAAGQRCTVLLNDHRLGEVAVDSAWTDHVFAAPIPDDVLRDGGNTLVLRSSERPDSGQPLGVYLRELSVVAQLTIHERERWQERLAAPPLPADRVMGRSTWQPTRPSRDRRPDVLMVLFDATWAAHASCYGYHRETTPNLDRLAADALVMEHCHSVAPYTAIAVPTLLTGRHWREHGVFGHGQALADSVVTLAEMLSAAGYFTLAHSDIPYVSRGAGTDQGFAEFREIWTDPAYLGVGLSPELSEQRFLERARRGFGDDPVFAYLHLMPPHSPYYPGREHDLWSDPDYAGPYDGSADQLERIDVEGIELSRADQERIVALYDGNLHRADASLGRMLAGWHALGRDRELLVIVLSDHGEAFGEHGRYQHLSTVYDEMHHVPLVLWPREAWSEFAPLRSRLVSLADVTPMLLRRLGVAPPTDLRWTARARQLLAGETPGPAEVVMRTVATSHTFGLRTERHLAVFDGLVGQKLYDLQEDPGATVNLRGERPDLYRELLGRMRAILGAREPVVAPRHEITEQERRALESLGY